MSRKRPLPPAPATGSRWKRKMGPLEDKPARVIGVVEDYVVIRYPRAVPRCFHVRDFYAEWTPEAPTRADRLAERHADKPALEEVYESGPGIGGTYEYECPACGRHRAYNVAHLRRGFCPVNFVPDDPEAEQDCREHAAKREKKK